jgi:gas vesicle protein
LSLSKKISKFVRLVNRATKTKLYSTILIFMGNTSKSLVLLLTGVAAGVTLGVLFAPKKGKENREKLAKGLIGLRDAAVDQMDNILTIADNLLITIKTKSEFNAYQHDDIENAII